MRYTILCCKCQAKRVYEATTLGEAMDQAHADGWRPAGKMTYRVCGKCVEVNEHASARYNMQNQ